MELKILVVSDSHESFINLERIVSRSTPDIVIHAGDFCNIPSECFNDHDVHSEAIINLKIQCEILGRLNKPLYIIPGNHDPYTTFCHLETENSLIDVTPAKLLGKTPENIAPGLSIAALGGSQPGFINDLQVWSGTPYDTVEKCDQVLTDVLIPQLAGDGQFIVLTHIGPAFSSTSKSYESNGSIIESGSHKLQEILTQNYEKILLNIHGHTHNAEGVFSYGSKLTKVINPGSALYGKYAEITLKYTENSWSIFEINLKQV